MKTRIIWLLATLLVPLVCHAGGGSSGNSGSGNQGSASQSSSSTPTASSPPTALTCAMVTLDLNQEYAGRTDVAPGTSICFQLVHINPLHTYSFVILQASAPAAMLSAPDVTAFTSLANGTIPPQGGPQPTPMAVPASPGVSPAAEAENQQGGKTTVYATTSELQAILNSLGATHTWAPVCQTATEYYRSFLQALDLSEGDAIHKLLTGEESFPVEGEGGARITVPTVNAQLSACLYAVNGSIPTPAPAATSVDKVMEVGEYNAIQSQIQSLLNQMQAYATAYYSLMSIGATSSGYTLNSGDWVSVRVVDNSYLTHAHLPQTSFNGARCSAPYRADQGDDDDGKPPPVWPPCRTMAIVHGATPKSMWVPFIGLLAPSGYNNRTYSAVPDASGKKFTITDVSDRRVLNVSSLYGSLFWIRDSGGPIGWAAGVGFNGGQGALFFGGGSILDRSVGLIYGISLAPHTVLAQQYAGNYDNHVPLTSAPGTLTANKYGLTLFIGAGVTFCLTTCKPDVANDRPPAGFLPSDEGTP